MKRNERHNIQTKYSKEDDISTRQYWAHTERCQWAKTAHKRSNDNYTTMRVIFTWMIEIVWRMKYKHTAVRYGYGK